MASAVYPYNAKAIIGQLRSVLVSLAFGGMSRVLPRAWPLVGPMSYSVTVGWSLSVWGRFSPPTPFCFPIGTPVSTLPFFLYINKYHTRD